MLVTGPLVLLALLACGCGGARPSLEEATRLLRDDGAALSRLALPGKAVTLTRETSGCPAGTARGVYTLTGDLPQDSGAQAPAAVASTLAAEFHRMGYQEGESPQERFGLNVSVVRKESLGIVFTVALRSERPNVEITGTTACAS
ncbi:hypothetical protein Sme01_70190 [Sphaerisporangium melleum]|uniref:Uncharacterized protein n=1 Tax=Sphaerisporangium melleum TaxID=321316 RepID=A0A917RNL9_9ACTN|nr:hypothetical protein GCM10007964_66650 [Sphaerisporangium melleum]GII74543.1 hypothetical protein Sme01_70190 [Sphaerisporangium melleum]